MEPESVVKRLTNEKDVPLVLEYNSTIRGPEGLVEIEASKLKWTVL
jgi:hypothetical protein